MNSTTRNQPSGLSCGANSLFCEKGVGTSLDVEIYQGALASMFMVFALLMDCRFFRNFFPPSLVGFVLRHRCIQLQTNSSIEKYTAVRLHYVKKCVCSLLCSSLVRRAEDKSISISCLIFSFVPFQFLYKTIELKCPSWGKV